jgi:hypothetical protein
LLKAPFHDHEVANGRFRPQQFAGRPTRSGRRGKSGAKAKPNEIWRIENIATPAIAQESGYVTPNVNVVYGFGFMVLAPSP